jgi:hypothetical protein
MGAMTTLRSVLVALFLMAFAPASAHAAPPANDARADATAIAVLPSTQNATTAEATTETAEHEWLRAGAGHLTLGAWLPRNA